MPSIRLANAALSRIVQPGQIVQVHLPLALDEYSEPEPDISVVPGTPRNYLKAHPNLALLAIEVADTSLEFDREWKGSRTRNRGSRITGSSISWTAISVPPPRMKQGRFGWHYSDRRSTAPPESIAPLFASAATLRISDLIP